MKGRLVLLLILAALLAVCSLFFFSSSPSPDGTAEKGSEPADESTDKPRTDGRSLLPSKFPKQPDEEGAPPDPGASRFAMAIEAEPALSGIEFQPASDDDRKLAGVTEQYGRGVTVTRIHPDSSAAEVAMKIGDVIVRAQKENVNSVEDLKRITGERDHVVVNFMREGQLLSVVLQKPYVAPP